MNEYSIMTFPLANNWMPNTMSYEDTLRIAHEAGLKYVDILGVDDAAVPQYLAAMEKYPVKIKCYTSYLRFLGDRDELEAAMKADLERAHRLGAELFMIVAHQAHLDHECIQENGPEWTISRMIEGYKLAIEMAKPYDITVCFETTPHDESRLSGMDDCKRVLDSVPGLGYVMDTANMLPHGDDPIEHYEAMKKYIIHIHLKDVALANIEDMPNTKFIYERTAEGKVMRCVMHGEGVIPLKEIYGRLMQDGYKGDFAIEYAPPRDRYFDIEANVEQVRKFVAYTKN